MKVHTETSRKFDNPAKLLTYSDRAKPYFNKLKAQDREKARERMRNSRQKKRAGSAVQDGGENDDDDDAEDDSDEDESDIAESLEENEEQTRPAKPQSSNQRKAR